MSHAWPHLLSLDHGFLLCEREGVKCLIRGLQWGLCWGQVKRMRNPDTGETVFEFEALYLLSLQGFLCIAGCLFCFVFSVLLKKKKKRKLWGWFRSWRRGWRGVSFWKHQYLNSTQTHSMGLGSPNSSYLQFRLRSTALGALSPLPSFEMEVGGKQASLVIAGLPYTLSCSGMVLHQMAK